MASSNTCENTYSVSELFERIDAMNTEERNALFRKWLFKNHEEIRNNDEEIKKIKDRTKEIRTEVRREVIKENAKRRNHSLGWGRKPMCVSGKQLLEENHEEIVEDEEEISQIKRRTENLRKNNEFIRKILR